MRTFRCRCGARIFFENTRCLCCQGEVGFLPDVLILSSIEPAADGQFSMPERGLYRKCTNYANDAVCNWMVSSRDAFCRACELNHVIPDLSQPGNRDLWVEVEKAKRRLVYGLARLGLPLRSKREDPEHGLAFDIKATVGSVGVLTGYEDGLITLNLAEADPAEREKVRQAMKERYRTLLGHFRHEVGHYYWDVLVRGTPNVAAFRDIFGDESQDYGQALKRHYEGRTRADHEAFISTYAMAHPWEDSPRRSR